MSKARVILWMSLASLAPLCAAQAGSIWARGHRRTQAIFADDTAKGVGDVLTIIIEERSRIQNETERTMNKSDSRGATATGNLDFLRALDTLTGKMFGLHKIDFSAEADTTFDGSADYDSDRSLTDQITVVVEDILPNGNLVVLGTRNREVAGDEQIIQISGVVRPSDIDQANTVSSMQVAEFRIVYKTRGQENRFTNPGWAAKIFNFLNPF